MHKVAGAISDLRPPTTSHHGAAGVWLGRALFRALRPYASRSQSVHESILEALQALDTAIERIEVQLDALRARVEQVEPIVGDVRDLDNRVSSAAGWVIPRIGLASSTPAEAAIVIPAPVAHGTGPPPGCSRVETRAGNLWVIDRDTVITPNLREYGTWEPEFARIAAGYIRPGMTVIDVGANIGFATRTMAALLQNRGTLIAIEPEPLNFRVLCSNAAEIDDDITVHCVPVAASDRTGSETLWLDENNLGDHRTWTRGARSARAIQVPSIRLDELIEGNVQVQFVKVDTQGTDMQVVAGMQRIISHWHPTLYVEFWPYGIEGRGQDPVCVLEYYHSLGFRISVADIEKEISSDRDILDYVRSRPDGYIDLVLTPA